MKTEEMAERAAELTIALLTAGVLPDYARWIVQKHADQLETTRADTLAKRLLGDGEAIPTAFRRPQEQQQRQAGQPAGGDFFNQLRRQFEAERKLAAEGANSDDAARRLLGR